MSDYDTDILLWSEQQAVAPRRRAANELDWDNVTEEIERVGQSQLSAVRSHILQAFLHDLKAEGWPLSRDAPHWRAEARRQRIEAAEGVAVTGLRRHRRANHGASATGRSRPRAGLRSSDRQPAPAARGETNVAQGHNAAPSGKASRSGGESALWVPAGQHLCAFFRQMRHE